MRPPKKGRSRRYTVRSLLVALATACGIVYWSILGSLIQQHEAYHAVKQPAAASDSPRDVLEFSRFETPVLGELRSSSQDQESECAINLFGLPRSFKDHVLPSLVTNVISVNQKYRCDYFVHFFNATNEEFESSNNTASMGGPQDVYLLQQAVEKQRRKHNKMNNKKNNNKINNQRNNQRRNHVGIVSDTNQDFSRDRKAYIDEIISGGDSASNPYFVHEASSFTEESLWNILKMWHSQDKVWNLMEEHLATNDNKPYKRVAMLRLDVIYTTPIDVYKVPNETVPTDYNDAYLQSLTKWGKNREPVEYFYDTENGGHCVVPGFKSFPVNDRYFVGPYEAVKIWAKDRFSRARKHVREVLPALESQKQNTELAAATEWGNLQKFTDYGLYDERFVAHSLLPAIWDLNPDIQIHVDRELYFLRVREDGSIWLKDKPGLGRVKKGLVEKALGRKCLGDPYEVSDPVLKDDKNPARWQLKCPPNAEKRKKKKKANKS